MLYAFLAWCARHALRWCWRDVHVVGTVPTRGPVLLAVNHANDLADICAVLAHVPRRVTFVANVSAAESRLVAWAYDRMGVVPVHRVRDARKAKARGMDSAAANAQAFARVRDVLAAGGCVCVFPEGGVHRGPHLGALRTGLARMALDAQASGRAPGLSHRTARHHVRGAGGAAFARAAGGGGAAAAGRLARRRRTAGRYAAHGARGHAAPAGDAQRA